MSNDTLKYSIEHQVRCENEKKFCTCNFHGRREKVHYVISDTDESILMSNLLNTLKLSKTLAIASIF